MAFFDFLFPSVESIIPVDLITLALKVLLTVVFVVLAIVIIKWLPKGKVAGLIVCLIAIVIVWLYI